MFLQIKDPRTETKLYIEFNLLTSTSWKSGEPTFEDIDIKVKSVLGESDFVNEVVNSFQGVPSHVWEELIDSDDMIEDHLYSTFSVFADNDDLSELAEKIRFKMERLGVE